MKPRIAILALAAVVLQAGLPFVAGPLGSAQAQAQNPEQRRLEQIRRLQQQSRSLQTENTRLQASQNELQSRLDSEAQRLAEAEKAAAQLDDRLKAERGRAEREVARLEAALAAEREMLAKYQAALAERDGLLDAAGKSARELRAQLAQSQQHGRGLSLRGDRLERELLQCGADNGGLVALVDALAERYRSLSVADLLGRADPLGLGRAEADRLAERYREQAGDLRFVAGTGQPSAEARQ